MASQPSPDPAPGAAAGPLGAPQPPPGPAARATDSQAAHGPGGGVDEALRDRVSALFRSPPGADRLGDATPGEIADAVLAELAPELATPAELARRQRWAYLEAGLCPRCGTREHVTSDGTGRLCDACTTAIDRLRSWEQQPWHRFRQLNTGRPLHGPGYTAAELLGIGTDDTAHPASSGLLGVITDWADSVDERCPAHYQGDSPHLTQPADQLVDYRCERRGHGLDTDHAIRQGGDLVFCWTDAIATYPTSDTPPPPADPAEGSPR